MLLRSQSMVFHDSFPSISSYQTSKYTGLLNYLVTPENHAFSQATVFLHLFFLHLAPSCLPDKFPVIFLSFISFTSFLTFLSRCRVTSPWYSQLHLGQPQFPSLFHWIVTILYHSINRSQGFISSHLVVLSLTESRHSLIMC